MSTESNVLGMAHFLDWGSLQYALNAAMSAALYYDHTGEEAYRDFAVSQLEYAMGINGYNRSFIVGWGTNPPIRPHHKNSHGHQALDWDLSDAHLYPLLGAMVGGPTLAAADVSAPGYVDDIDDYVGNEVTIAYNAGLVATAAFVVDLLGRP